MWTERKAQGVCDACINGRVSDGEFRYEGKPIKPRCRVKRPHGRHQTSFLFVCQVRL